MPYEIKDGQTSRQPASHPWYPIDWLEEEEEDSFTRLWVDAIPWPVYVSLHIAYRFSFLGMGAKLFDQ